MPNVSVIVPVYNVEKYLRQCLDSVVNQTLKDIEIICVNDGSTDKSAEILEEYADRVTIVNQKNAGLSGARNTGIKHATGEYIGFVDSDDFVAPDFFEKLYAAAAKYNADIALTNICRPSGRAVKLKSLKEEKLFTEMQDRINAASIPTSNYVWNRIYRKEILQHEFVLGRYFEDMEWSIKTIYAAKSLVTVPGTAYYYRKNPASIIRGWETCDKKRDDFELSENEMYDFAGKYGINLGPKRIPRTRVRVFGFTFIDIYNRKYKSVYKLFGVIPFLAIER